MMVVLADVIIEQYDLDFRIKTHKNKYLSSTIDHRAVQLWVKIYDIRR